MLVLIESVGDPELAPGPVSPGPGPGLLDAGEVAAPGLRNCKYPLRLPCPDFFGGIPVVCTCGELQNTMNKMLQKVKELGKETCKKLSEYLSPQTSRRTYPLILITLNVCTLLSQKQTNR
jgi:hypothetical protein